MRTIVSYQNKDELDQGAADIISQSINRMLEKQKTVVFGIVGGRSVSGIFRRLRTADISWEKTHIFMLDERIVPLDSPQSNFRLAKENFIDELLMNKRLLPENVHPFVMNICKPDLAISDYEDTLQRYGDIYDIILLSSGEDGHVAGLYPKHHSVSDESPSYIIFNDSPKPPKDRMSISRRLLVKSKVAILLFEGKTKRSAYAKFQDKHCDFNSCPGKLILLIDDSYVLTNLR
ncbi:hypothetical protein LCGC14_1003730 [marine sediment metagenome]|uniref:Glucosamine/galactosamine-6-phosphate isomerase domain-containing protein n=1 Tax=marine sediment metagenome TaxID=412755 RepID=A0A0F9N295_9ZZZZ